MAIKIPKRETFHFPTDGFFSWFQRTQGSKASNLGSSPTFTRLLGWKTLDKNEQNLKPKVMEAWLRSTNLQETCGKYDFGWFRWFFPFQVLDDGFR